MIAQHVCLRGGQLFGSILILWIPTSCAMGQRTYLILSAFYEALGSRSGSLTFSVACFCFCVRVFGEKISTREKEIDLVTLYI